ncbi:MAG: tyrosine-type recombinase/integrase [Bacillota bacterium]|nr:tyrosine-type recombinase/integrase [Bacillota bacterium]
MLQNFFTEGLRGKSKETIKTYKYAIEQFEIWLDGAGTNLQEYSRTDIQLYINYLVGNGKSAATINKIWNALKKYSLFVSKSECIKDISVIKPPSIFNTAPKSLSRNEANSLVRQIDRSNNIRDLAICLVLLNCGLRLSELVFLDKRDVIISDRKGEIIVRYGKGNKERTVPLNSETRRAIIKYLETRMDNNHALFLSNRGERVSGRAVQHIFNKYDVNVHSLRHTFITRLVRNNEDFSLVQSLSGHSSADMVIRYSAPTEEDKINAVNKL